MTCFIVCNSLISDPSPHSTIPRAGTSQESASECCPLPQDSYRDRALWGSLLAIGHKSTLVTAAPVPCFSATLSLTGHEGLFGQPAWGPATCLLRCSLGAGGQQALDRENLPRMPHYPLLLPDTLHTRGAPFSLLPHTPCSPKGLNFWKDPKPERPTDTFCFKS